MLEEFYGAVLPRTGYFCLFNKETKQHIWAESHAELAGLTRRYQDREGIYFATASYESAFARKQHNVRHLRSLRVDIDVGKPKGDCYPTKKVALAAIIGFIKESQLPPTYIVSSGKGFHIYWCMDADCAPADWVPMAEGLQRRGVAAGLLIDSTCTIDTARILRPPGTIHHDDVRVALLPYSGQVWSVADLRGALVSAAAEPDVVDLVPTRAYDTSINREAIIEVVQRPPVSAVAVAGKCAALHYAASVGGDVPEPYWRAMLGLVKHTIEGEDLAHEWSMGHPDYDEDQTQKKIEGWTAGPTTCAEFSNHTRACETCIHRGTVRSPVLLVNPPLPAQVATPPQTVLPASVPVAGSPAAPPFRPFVLPAKPWQDHLPPGYDVDTSADGKTHTLFTLEQTDDINDDGRPVMRKVEITHNVWWMGQWAGAAHSEEKARLTICLLEHGAVKNYTVEQNILAAMPEFKKTLADFSIHPLPGKKASQAMQDYGLNLLQHIHHQGKRLQISDHLGLRILPDGKLVATQGEHTIFPDGHIEHSMIAGHLRDVARQFRIPLPDQHTGNEWGPEVWQHIEPLATQHVDFLKKHYSDPGMERLQVAIMLGLASPFMPFVEGKFQSGFTLPRGGLSVSLFSRASGSGKTTAVASAIAAFGSPADLTNDSGKSGTTEFARVARLTIHGTLPNIMDEMGSNSPAAVAAAVSTVANGAARERATREGGLNISAPWALVNLMTTNTSQRDMIAAVQESSDAIQQRLLEINVDDLPEFGTAKRTQFTYDWMSVQQKCVGALGAVIHREICKRGVTEINNLVLQCVARADAKLEAKQGNRFQYRGLGAMFALFVILKEIGIEIFPMKGVLDAFKQAHDAGQTYIAENTMPTDPLEVISRMLHDIGQNTVVTEGETHLGGRQTVRNYDRAIGNMPLVVSARHVRETGRTYVSVDAMKEWCRNHTLSETELIKRAREAEVLKLHQRGERVNSWEKFNLLKGMAENSGAFIKCYFFETHKLARRLGMDVGDVPGAHLAPPPPTNVVPMRQ